MKQIKTKSGDIGIIEVPKLSFYFDWSWQSSNKIDPKIQIYWETEDDRIDGIITDFKDPKDFEILGKLSELTDKDCEEFVEALNSVYLDYLNPDYAKADYTNEWGCNSTKESFISLLQSEGVDTSKEFLIIKIL